MHWLDYLVVVAVLVGLVLLGLSLAKKSGKNSDEFLVAGRKMPWWLIGFSDVAVGLNTSSMLQDSRKVRQDGVIGLMHIWGFAFKNCISGVFFERLWRRARFKTQMEFYESRYSGWQATFARVYDTVVFGGFVSAIWAAVGLVGMKKVVSVVLELPATVPILGFSVSTEAIVVISVVLVAITYSAASGAHGIYWTDLVEFVIAVVAMYALLGILYVNIGGSVGLRENLEALPAADKGKYLGFLQPLSIIYLYMFVINPLLDHGGFSPGMQRTLSLKNEREVLYSMIFRTVLGFVIRGVPFIAIGLISIFLITDSWLLENYSPLTTPEGALIPDWERAFPALVKQYLPVGLLGLMTAAFICAFMSSFDSNIHLSGSVLVNDLYRPYLVKGKSDHHYVLATKWVMVMASIVTILIGIFADDILHLGYLAIMITIGGGWIKLLRLIWWRSNGAAEVAAQMFAIIVFGIILSPVGGKLVLSVMGWLNLQGNDAFFVVRNMSAGITCTVFALLVMALSKPEPMDKLCSFYQRMRPFGFWGPVRAQLAGKVSQPDSIGVQLALTLSSLAVVWGAFFGSMSLLLAFWQSLAASILMMITGAYGSYLFILRLYPKDKEIEEYDELV